LAAMTIDEYKELILLHVEKARDCEQGERIVARSIEKMRQKNLPEPLIADYLGKLREGLESLSQNDFDPVHWCNIKDVILYLKNYH
jgi:hypothetical protein